MTDSGVDRDPPSFDGFREEIARAADSSRRSFFTWFDKCEDIDAAFVRGAWDFAVHVAGQVRPFLAGPDLGTVLEIGYGGGRLLCSAARYCRRAIGVDIHEQSELVSEELERRGVRNATLLKSDGRTIPLPDRSVDLAYSFIVLQHVERMDVLNSYWAETFRVLRPGGIAVLYWGRFRRFSFNRPWRVLYALDRIFELIVMPKGYRERKAAVNDVNLIATMPHVRRLARKVGFQVLRTTVSQACTGPLVYRGQHGLVLQKL